MPWRAPALWAMATLILGSVVWLVERLAGAAANPGRLGFAVAVWVCYAVVLTAIVTRLSGSDRPPTWAVVLAALWGGLAAAMLAELIATSLRPVIADKLGPESGAWISALAAPLPEELCKVAGLVLLALIAGSGLRNPWYGMVIGAIVGVAFNAAEGLAYGVAEGAGSVHPLWTDVLVRGFLTGLLTHAGLSAIAGAGVGYLFARRTAPLSRRLAVLVGLLCTAVALHALIDSPLLDEWGIGGVMLKELPVLALVVPVGRFARIEFARERRRMRSKASCEPVVHPYRGQ
jgi:RsiW-degrading membrane proteinase PrsW (M82 family)